jgi:RNA 2'-O ribose methyltransferase substrate binding
MFPVSSSTVRAIKALYEVHLARGVSTASAIQRGIGRSSAAPTRPRRTFQPIQNVEAKKALQPQRGKWRSREAAATRSPPVGQNPRFKGTRSASVSAPAGQASALNLAELKRAPQRKTAAAAAQERTRATPTWPRDSRATKPRSPMIEKRERKVPVSIPYTTPASEFLYGRSAVEAVLKAGRRKLYKLYFNNSDKAGASRLIAEEPLIRLAHAKGVPVNSLRREDAGRLLDAMSGGRPHNVSQR